MLMRTRERKTIVTQQEKVKNETRQQMNNLFQRLCSIDPFCCLESIITYLRRADFIFAPGKPSWAKPTVLDTFSKSSTLPRKNWQQTASWSFSCSFSPATIAFKTVLRPIFIWRGTSRDLIARSTASRPKKLAPLAKKLVKLDSAVASIVFQELCHLLAIFFIVVVALIALC